MSQKNKEKNSGADQKIAEAMRFYLMAAKLKYKIRSAWDETHWNINKDRLESIAEHVYGVCILAISIDSEFDMGIDMSKVLRMLVIHEVGEVLIGDITPFDNVSPEEKETIEHQAMIDILGDLGKKEELLALLLEFDERKTKESQFAYLCDKLEADIQAKVYQDMGCQRTLDDQANNIVFNNPKISLMIEEGASSAFDIWYEWDRDKYNDAPVFYRCLKHIKNKDTNV